MAKGRRKRKNGGCDSRQTPNVEPTAIDEPVATNENPTFTTPVGITVDSFRTRSCDTDGPSPKAIIDGLTHCGILRGDSAKEVAWVKLNAPRKVKSEEEEKTIITIEEV
jgi:hypothetical protein